LFNDANKVKQLKEKGKTSDETAIVTIKVYYTAEYAKITNNVKEAVENIIAKTNQGYINNKIKLQLKLHCLELFNQAEDFSTTSAMMVKFQHSKGTTKKLLGGADLTMLMLSQGIPAGGGTIMGAAYPVWYLPIGWTAKAGAETYVTFAHEAGHMFSAGHDQTTLQDYGDTPEIPYGRGFLVKGTRKHTIMA
jgi:hypothetical protein